jgi:hypothetical protein
MILVAEIGTLMQFFKNIGKEKSFISWYGNVWLSV